MRTAATAWRRRTRFAHRVELLGPRGAVAAFSRRSSSDASAGRTFTGTCAPARSRTPQGPLTVNAACRHCVRRVCAEDALWQRAPERAARFPLLTRLRNAPQLSSAFCRAQRCSATHTQRPWLWSRARARCSWSPRQDAGTAGAHASPCTGAASRSGAARAELHACVAWCRVRRAGRHSLRSGGPAWARRPGAGDGGD